MRGHRALIRTANPLVHKKTRGGSRSKQSTISSSSWRACVVEQADGIDTSYQKDKLACPYMMPRAINKRSVDSWRCITYVYTVLYMLAMAEVVGATRSRWQGSRWHITQSLAPGEKEEKRPQGKRYWLCDPTNHKPVFQILQS